MLKPDPLERNPDHRGDGSGRDRRLPLALDPGLAGQLVHWFAAHPPIWVEEHGLPPRWAVGLAFAAARAAGHRPEDIGSAFNYSPFTVHTYERDLAALSRTNNVGLQRRVLFHLATLNPALLADLLS